MKNKEIELSVNEFSEKYLVWYSKYKVILIYVSILYLIINGVNFFVFKNWETFIFSNILYIAVLIYIATLRLFLIFKIFSLKKNNKKKDNL